MEGDTPMTEPLASMSGEQKHIEQHHHAMVTGYICPEEGHFVVAGHFLDDGCRHGHSQEAHVPAVQVVTIYKLVS
jgi:hypothetical protein